MTKGSKTPHKNKKDRCKPHDTFGDLTLLKRVNKPKGQYGDVWIANCSCGSQTKFREQYLFRVSNPKRNCGGTKHTATLMTIHKREYGIWKMMNKRCHDPTHVAHKWYGAIGIRVHPPWRDHPGVLAYNKNLAAFTAWLGEVGPAPSTKHTLDRKNPFRGYVPGNLRWATMREQNRNKRIHHVRAYQERARNKAAEAARVGVTSAGGSIQVPPRPK